MSCFAMELEGKKAGVMSNQLMEQGGSRKKQYFMIFVCMIMQAIPFGVAQNIQPLFIPYVVKEFNFSLAAFSLIFTFGALASSIFSPFLGKLFGKINIKVLFIVGTALSSLGFLGFGLAKNLPTFYALSAVSQIGCVLFSGLGVPYVINHWFPKKGRGTALGIAFSGGSIGNVFLQPMVSNMLAEKGSSFAYITFGLVSLIVSLVIVLLFIRLPKAGEVQENSSDDDSKKEVKTSKTFEGLSAVETRKNKYFWTFGIGYALIAVAIAACSTQYASYFKLSLQLDSQLIGILGSVFAIFCLIGNVGGGTLFDKLGSFNTMLIGCVLQALSIIGMLLASTSHNFAFVFSICYGLCVFSYMSGPAFMASDVFGTKESSVKLGLISLFFAVGFALGSTIFGEFAQLVGFNVAWIAMIVFLAVGYFLLLSSIRLYKKEVQKMAS